MLVLAPMARADWIEGQPYKWLQRPDLTLMGYDIRIDQNGGPRRVADDWSCTQVGPVTDVHIWGSWLNDLQAPPGINFFNVRFWTDDPAGLGGSDPGNQYSKPDSMVWEGMIARGDLYDPAIHQGQFVGRLQYTVPEEKFLDPVTGIQGWDHQVWQYNMYIDPADAWIQQGTKTDPITYWLEVQAFTANTFDQFGWKTRDLADGHFADDAVYWVPQVIQPGYWLPLEYPTGGSMDMSFVITPEPATMCLLGLGAVGMFIRRRGRK
jgi:hypothetical protein